MRNRDIANVVGPFNKKLLDYLSLPENKFLTQQYFISSDYLVRNSSVKERKNIHNAHFLPYFY
jgi:hypothetical protein